MNDEQEGEKVRAGSLVRYHTVAMKRSLPTLALLAILTLSTFAQHPGGGGPPAGGGAGLDANPFNSANWRVEFVREESGESVSVSWNAQTGTTLTERNTHPRAVAAAGAEPSIPVSATATATARGKLICRMTWIGVGPPPPKALVRLFGQVAYPNEGSGVLGLPITSVGSDPRTGRGVPGTAAYGELYRLLSLSGRTAETSIEGSVTCTVTWPAGNGLSGQALWSANATVAPRALGMSTDSVPTYHRAYSLSGVVFQEIDDLNDLSERTMTMGYSLSGPGFGGTIAFHAGARPVGDWVAPGTGQWSGSFATFESPNGESADASTSATQATLLGLSVADTHTTGNVSLFYSEVYPRSNGQMLPGMNSKLLVNMHAPTGFIARTQKLRTGGTIPLCDANGNVVRATVVLGQSQSYTVGSSFTATHLPSTVTISPALDVKRSDFVTLKLAGSIAVPTDTQDAYQTFRSQTFTINGTTSYPQTFELVADETWKEATDTEAAYGPHGFEGDHKATFAMKGTYGLAHRWQLLEEN